MRGEDVGCRHDLKRGIKIELLLNCGEANAFEGQKRRVAFVHVKHIRFDAERAQRLHAANPEDNFLAHPHFQVAAVKLSSDQSVLRAVLRSISVEKIETHAADAQLPKLRENLAI